LEREEEAPGGEAAPLGGQLATSPGLHHMLNFGFDSSHLTTPVPKRGMDKKQLCTGLCSSKASWNSTHGPSAGTRLDSHRRFQRKPLTLAATGLSLAH
jgi:hypothetical protein